jgi:acetyl esterase
VYTPNTSDTTGGAIVYFHGGGWVLGDLDSHDAVCRALANASGSIVISTDYRLAPEHRFPAAADDAYAATRWVADNATLLRIDPKKVAVAGDSAGGNLAAAVTLMARDQAGPDLAFQVLIYPVTDANFDTPSYIENAVGYLLTRTGMQWYWNHYTAEADRTNPYASPSRATTLGALPPALVITAEYDPLRDEGEAYATALRSAGVPTTLTRYPGLVHGFLGYFGIFDESRAAIAEIGAAVRAALTAERKIPV